VLNGEDEHQYHLLWRVSVLEQALSQLGQGIIMLSAAGEIIFATREAENILAHRDGLSRQENRLAACLPQDHERLQEVLSGFGDNHQDKTYKGFYIHRNNQRRPYLLYASAISLAETQETGIMLIVKDMQANMMHWLERLKVRYGLTNREAEIATLLSEGRSAHEIGQVMEIAEDTVRQYLKNCYRKMGVQKQHELVSLALDSSRRR
jgi:DNA-binding CsgD family transcriptional regulator